MSDGDYTDMSPYYDVIMTSGYYPYYDIADELAGHTARKVLELGCGTGLILEQVADVCPDWMVTGVDGTPAMLEIAEQRLKGLPQITTTLQDVSDLSLERDYDLAFSYGGVWYFAGSGDATTVMVSHIGAEDRNRRALEQVADHLLPGATLLLGIQKPHVDYSRPVSNGMLYRQEITHRPDGGFSKVYSLMDNGKTVMRQTTAYRTYRWRDALELLAKCGFEPAPSSDVNTPLFRAFTRR